MTIQRIHGSSAVHILERAIRVMVYAHYRLCESTPAQFDSSINATHIQECLKRLLCLYPQENTCHCHQGDFTALYLMFNLGSPEALRYGLDHKLTLGDCSTFQLALSISLAWWRRNYIRVFRLVRRLPVLHMCAFNNVRHLLVREALCIMCSGYNSKNISFLLGDLQSVLDLDNENVTCDVCEACGLEVANGKVKFQKSSFKLDAKVSPSCQTVTDEDLLWEDVSLLLIGPKCDCVLSEVT